MKKWIIIVAAAAALGAGWYLLSPLWRNIELNEESPLVGMTPPAMDGGTAVAIPPEVRLISQGDFVASAHEVAGRALLIETNQGRTVRFENFETINGPDLFIYLSADLEPRDFINLGKIRATKGNVNYEVPAGTDTEKYNKVLVWCRAFRVLFSYAALQ